MYRDSSLQSGSLKIIVATQRTSRISFHCFSYLYRRQSTSDYARAVHWQKNGKRNSEPRDIRLFAPSIPASYRGRMRHSAKCNHPRERGGRGEGGGNGERKGREEKREVMPRSALNSLLALLSLHIAAIRRFWAILEHALRSIARINIRRRSNHSSNPRNTRAHDASRVAK